MVAARMELGSWLFFYFEPRERMRAPNPVKEVRHIGLMGEELPAYLNTLRALEPRQFDAVERAVKAILPQIDGIDVDVNDLGEVELRLREGGVSVTARLLSEGTLRILGMLALIGAKEAPALVGFEEPENGIHPRRIELIAELLKTRATIGVTQYIVTTHSPILPDLIPEDALYAVRRTDAGTRIEPLAYWGPLGRRAAAEHGAFAPEAHVLTVSERVLRGDFDD
jgi:predicted ATPase